MSPPAPNQKETNQNLRHKLTIVIALVAASALLSIGLASLSLLDADRPVIPEIVCSDFESWEAANEHFESIEEAYKLDSGLDTNRNGIPCEMLMQSTNTDINHQGFNVVCDDFRHKQEARYFFESHGGPEQDPYRLDADRDNVPCESLPSLDDFDKVIAKLQDDQTPVANRNAETDPNCGDFQTWAQAYRVFIDAGGPEEDPYRLDGNSDGVPCQSLPDAPKEGTPIPQATTVTSDTTE